MGTRLSQPVPLEARCELKRNNIVNFFDESRKSFFVEHAGDFVITNSTVDHLWKSVKKMDAAVCYKFREDETYPSALDFVAGMFDPVFRLGEMGFYDILGEVVIKTSSGVIDKMRGLPKKEDCLKANLPYTEYVNPDTDEVPIWQVSGKVEVKERSSYIGETKQRTFIIEPFHHLWMTKRFYGLQNKGLMMQGWSYYGFNPYEGGVNSLARSLLKHNRFWELDGKGWDRLMAMMVEIYQLRNRYREPSKELEWTYKWLINSVLQLPNGDVVFKSWGNNSGSGNTTGDNIIGMSIVIAMVLRKLGLDPSEFDKCVTVAIFGDDVVGSDSIPCSDEELEKAFRHVFTDLFGIVLDPFIISRDLADMHFLGFKFAQCEKNVWVPQYPLEKLCASVLGNAKSMDVRAEVSKLSSLMLMSAGHGPDVFNFFREALLDVVTCSADPYCEILRKHNLDVVIPKYSAVLDWYCGFEGPKASDEGTRIGLFLRFADLK